ncbi:hypothetical protein HX776_24425 [Pseudomonas agarici]|uniref:phage tail fiber protein n=1 Tax=Pseudomonas agarici TaxID=46677 RepID=UPI0003771E44|nr:hypothetical protein [Pseudomonas agarici]NWC11937.1 hypothetical protein [Pseudomonas agarici]SEL85641.1 hypothetical protein SAMN05216604_14024 [Pseudomonas agarici]
MSTITSANSVFALAVTNLFPFPQSIQGYASDSMFAMDALDIAETVMGVDGKLSAGFIFNSSKQTVSIMPDSPSLAVFSTWHSTMQTARDVYRANGTIILPSIGKKYTLKNGVLTSGKSMPDAKKTLQPVEYKITWERVTSEDYNG